MRSLISRLPSLVSLTVVLLWLLTSGCERRLSPARRAHAEQALHGRVEQWARAINNRALDTLAALYHQGPETFATTADGRRITGWEGLAALHRSSAASGTHFNFLIENIGVDILDENVGITSFRTSKDVEKDGAREVTRGWTTQVWKRESDGTPWRIRVEHHSTIAGTENR